MAQAVAVAVVTARAVVARRSKWREAAGAACSWCRSYITGNGGERGANDPLGRLAAYMCCCATRKVESSLPKAPAWQEDTGNEVGGYRITQVESWLCVSYSARRRSEVLLFWTARV